MPETKAEPAAVQDVIVDVIDGVRLYGRRTAKSTLTLNASDRERDAIERIAAMLHRKGYAVKRSTFVLDAKTHYDLQATWVGQGDCPYHVSD
ncbi:MAG TPA: hypothetical protein VNH11_30710 [Pirellulales bacterium]|nr:hypothetical protein [Pirellulales bacterium]